MTDIIHPDFRAKKIIKVEKVSGSGEGGQPKKEKQLSERDFLTADEMRAYLADNSQGIDFQALLSLKVDRISVAEARKKIIDWFDRDLIDELLAARQKWPEEPVKFRALYEEILFRIETKPAE
ncbi:MAG: hypothetical protein WC465_04725 [Patescibacteria group bacterium]